VDCALEQIVSHELNKELLSDTQGWNTGNC